MNGPWRALAGLALAVGLAATAYAVRIQISERTMLDVCQEVVRWRGTLSERALSDMGRASARAVAWRIPLRDGLTLGIPRAEVDGVYVEATGSRLDTFVLTFRGVAERSLTVSHRMGDLLAQRWSGDEPTYRELMTGAIAPEPPHLDCRRGLDRKAAVRASLAQAAAIVYLRIDSGAELFHTRAGNRTMVRRHYALENGDEWVDWNTLVPLGEDSGPPFATAHWRFSDAEIGAMAPMAEADDAAADEAEPGTAEPAAPAWVNELRDVIVQRDAGRLFALARDQHWSCAAAAGTRAPAWCVPLVPGAGHASTSANGSAVEPP